jgi:PLP dependent protein
MPPLTRDLAANLFKVRERIELAATRSGRRAEEITLIAVSKTHPARKIRELHEAGVRHFAENRVQEWESKRTHLMDLEAIWHMVGHVQKNKAARAAQFFHSVDSVDSLALAEKLDRARASFSADNGESFGQTGVAGSPKPANKLRVLIEVKLDPQPAKSGANVEGVPRLAEAILRLPNLNLCGLMGIPPYFDNPEETRLYFRSLCELRDRMHKQLGMDLLPVLSMGMSHDFEIAIEEGATEIRVGTALFGEREKA